MSQFPKIDRMFMNSNHGDTNNKISQQIIIKLNFEKFEISNYDLIDCPSNAG